MPSNRFLLILVVAALTFATACGEQQPKEPPPPPPASQPAAEPAEPAAAPEAEAPAPASEPAAQAMQPAEAAKPSATPMAAGDVAAGAAVYAKKCVTCHGDKGEGKEAIARMLKVELRALGSQEVQAKSDAELRKDIVEGTGKMKPVAGLSDKDLSDVVAFMRGLK